MIYPTLALEELFPSAHVDDLAERKAASIRCAVDRAVDSRFTPSPLSSSTLNVLRETE